MGLKILDDRINEVESPYECIARAREYIDLTWNRIVPMKYQDTFGAVWRADSTSLRAIRCPRLSIDVLIMHLGR